MRLIKRIWYALRTWLASKPVKVSAPKVFSSKPKDPYLAYQASIKAAADKVYHKYWLLAQEWRNRPKVRTGRMVRVMPGGRHALFESNIGLVRKPYVAG